MPHVDYCLTKRPLMIEEDRCGDAGVIREHDGKCFLALIDVLGHGAEAHEVAVLAGQYLEQCPLDDLVGVLKGLHECLRCTRGAVVALCLLDLATGELKYAGIGNITARILGPHCTRLVFRDGIVGYSMGTPREEAVRLSDGDVLVLYSDGVRQHFELYDCPGLLLGDAQTIATAIIRQFGKGDDDAACIAMRYTT